jgi:hypothetical protein
MARIQGSDGAPAKNGFLTAARHWRVGHINGEITWAVYECCHEITWGAPLLALFSRSGPSNSDKLCEELEHAAMLRQSV